mgnify:CR=1 FL=1
MYDAWGFRESPFQTSSLRADETGDRLLVGRVAEVDSFARHLAAPPRAVTVEGQVGVGKTSLVNVAIFRLLKRYVDEGRGRLYVPALEPLQLSDGLVVEEFLDSVYSLLARSLIQRAREVRGLGWSLPSTQALDQWLNDPLIERISGGLGSLNIQRTAEINDGVAYMRGGFRAEVRNWLQAVFPTSQAGGVVCLIDNLELLRTSMQARNLIENLRDHLFGIPGVRWVFCGANGITRSVAGSPRLDGYLHAPVTVRALGEESAREIFSSRLDAYRAWNAEHPPYLPLLEEDFVRLFDVLGSNTRSALKYADTYCLSVPSDQRLSDREKAESFGRWIEQESSAALQDCDSQIGPTAWRVFDYSCESLPQFAPGDYGSFGFQTSQAMVPHVAALEQNGLVESAIDETDQRRRTISITPKGWFVRLARQS